jgi:hypothetical protein
MTYDIGNPGPGLRQTHKCDIVNPVNGIPTSSLDTWISNGNTNIRSNKILNIHVLILLVFVDTKY